MDAQMREASKALDESALEKSKEKKEKREREKRESEERKEKLKDNDQSKDKDREKNDKKEKQRDKGKKKDEDRDKDSEKFSNERNGQGHTEGHNEGKSIEDGHKVDIHKDFNFIEELVRSIIDEENEAANQVGKQITSEFQRFTNMHSPTDKGKDVGNEVVHNINVPEQKRMIIVSAMENRSTTNVMPHSTEQRRDEGVGKSTDNDGKKKVEAKEKAEWKVDDRKGDKNKYIDREKRHKRKDKDRDKERAKEEKRREKEEHGNKEQDKSVNIRPRGHVDLQNTVSSSNLQENMTITGAKIRLKRKEIIDFLHEKEVRPNKLTRPASSSQLLMENKRKSDPSYVVSPDASDRYEAMNIMVERAQKYKKHNIDDVTDVLSPSQFGPPPSAGDTGSDETFNKPPHPDEKHLNQLLCLPRIEEWPEYDDQEWLLSKDDTRQKPKTKLEAVDIPQVWDKALHIDSADVLALPYVVPY